MVRSGLTVVLTHFKRHKNSARIMDALAGKCTVFVWDNSGTFDDDRADWIIRSSENVYCSGRYWMMKSADTEWVAGLDDDLLPREDMVDSTIYTMRGNPDALVGVAGVRLGEDRSYKDGVHIGMGKGPIPQRADQAVDIVKGRYMVAATKHMRLLPHLPKNLDELSTENDIRVSSYFSECLVSKDLCTQFSELPTAAEALHRRKDHWGRREEATRKYFDKTAK